MEGIRRALVLGIVLIAGTVIEYAPSVGRCYSLSLANIYCCRPTTSHLFGGVLPYFEVTGHPVPVSSHVFNTINSIKI